MWTDGKVILLEGKVIRKYKHDFKNPIIQFPKKMQILKFFILTMLQNTK